MVKWIPVDQARGYQVLKVHRKFLKPFTFNAENQYKEEKGVLFSAEEDTVLLGVLVWIGHPMHFTFEGGVEITARSYWGEEGCIPIFRRYLHKHFFKTYNPSAGWGAGGGQVTEDARMERFVPFTLLIEEEENLYYHRDARLIASDTDAAPPVDAWDVDIYLLLAQKRG